MHRGSLEEQIAHPGRSYSTPLQDISVGFWLRNPPFPFPQGDSYPPEMFYAQAELTALT